MTRPAPRPRPALAAALAGALATLALAGCNTDEVLTAPDPDVIPPSAIEASTSAALTLKAGVGYRFMEATSGSNGATDNTFLFGGLLADEWRSSDTFEQRNTTDQRVLVEQNTFLTGQYRALNRVRTEGDAAIRALRGALPNPAPAFHAGEVFAWGALALNLLGEHYCNGLILSSLDADGLEVFGEPVPVDSAFSLAAARADSGLASRAGGTAADSARVVNLASVMKGRALLNRGDFAGAAAAVSAVPTTFRYWVRHSLLSQSNQLWALNVNVRRYTVGEREGGNGLPFRSANDPRVPTTVVAGRLGFDSFTPWIGQARWGRTDSVMVASGIEARLIESEAQLRAGASTWLATLNNPRVTANGGVAGLAALADPGTPAARLDLVMRERAFWMFSTGHRLGDLRRLIRQYGRTQDQVFPSGAYLKGGNYGDAVNFPLPLVEQNNPKFPKAGGCTNRSA